MNSDVTSEFPQTADPAWDYYLTWHSFQVIKSKIESALTIMVIQEYGRASADEQMKELLEVARDMLTEIIDNELTFGDEEDDEEDDEEEE